MGLSKKHTDSDLIKYVTSCFKEADNARKEREHMTENNYDVYHMRHGFSHKREGQSREVLSKQRMAVESTKSFFQQALADTSEWFKIDKRDATINEDAMAIKPHEAQILLSAHLEKCKYFSHVGLAIQRGLLGGLMITKTHGTLIPKPKFMAKTEGKGKNLKKHVVAVDDKAWELRYTRVRNDDYYPDPTGKGLYEGEEIYMDLHEVKKLSEGEDAIYDKEKVALLSTAMTEDALHQYEKNRETGQDSAISHSEHRSRVKLKEYWGDVISSEGEVLYENIVMTVANDTHLIRKPTPNPLWHQKSPYTVTALLEVDNAVWPIALMDAASMHNQSMVEMLNLILDAAFKKVHSPSQIRTSDLENPEQVSDGIPPGEALKVKPSLPHGAKVLEPLEVVDVPNDALNVLNLLTQEFNASALTTDLRSGHLPDRTVKATEIVEQSQTITSVFQGLSKNIEQNQIVKELEMGWMTLCQNWDMLDTDELIAMFGEERGRALSQLSPQDVFVNTVNGYRFKVSGITQTLSKQQDFRKLTTLLQTISGSELLIEEFIQKYDMGKLLGEIMTSLNIDKHKITAMQAGPMTPSQPGATPGLSPTQDMASTPDAGATGSAFAELFGQDLAASGGPQ